MTKKGVFVDLNQLADVLTRQKKKRRKRRKQVQQKNRFITTDLTAQNAMISRHSYDLQHQPTPYRQQALYANGDLNRFGDRYDAGVSAEKGLKSLEEKGMKALEEIYTNSPLKVKSGDVKLPKTKHNTTVKRGHKTPNFKKTVIHPALPTKPLVTGAPPTQVFNSGFGASTRADGMTFHEATQGGGGVAEGAQDAPYGLRKDGLPKKRPGRKAVTSVYAEATPTYQNVLNSQQQPSLTDVLQQSQTKLDLTDE